MGGSIMTITSTALLCLETLLKPIIWAEPSSVVTHGRPVSIWCQGSRKARQYYLYQEGVREPSRSEFPLGPGDKVKFSILHMTNHLAGSYHCSYRSRKSWSVPSETLDLVVTGMFNRPTLSALPSPVVTSGDSVTLQCGSQQGFDRFILCDERGEHNPGRLNSQRQADGWSQVLSTVGPVSPGHRWAYRCYGYFSTSPYVWSSSSDILELLISGVSRKPFLSGLPGPVVGPGEKLTLQCCSDVGYDRFALFKEWGHDLPQARGQWPQAGLPQADFPLGQVSSSHGGRYRCYGRHNLSSEWSAPSDPLDILVAGEEPHPIPHFYLFPHEEAPTLSAHPGPTVAPGENVTLRCQTRRLFDTFYLSKKGKTCPPLYLRSQYQDGKFQASFLMNPVTLDHGGTYRCYGSLNSTPFLLSHPSDPLELVVTGAPIPVTPSVQTQDPTSGPQLPDYTVENLIRLGLSGLILVVLGLLLFEA
nr:PREDICTED: leukocyte immunoglobulin-like receptor subfamily A member 6 isoform X1 [Equus przewalskii]